MRVAVTGGAGFIGANLLKMLARQTWVDSLVAVDNLATGSLENISGVDVELLVGSILDAELLDRALDGVDAVVHLAALPSVPRSLLDPLASHHANATGTVMVLEAARRAGGPHLLVASSSSVYGANPTLPKQETLRPEPVSPYAVSKLATEAYGLAYQQCFGLDVLAFRFFNVFGPCQPAGHAYAAVVPAFVSAALEGRPLEIFGDGQQTRDFTYVGSVCAVIAGALHRRVTHHQPVNLAFGGRTSLLALIDEIADIVGSAPTVQHRDPRPGDVRDSQADTTRLRLLFPDVAPTPLRKGLEETVAWFRSVPPAV
jgi:UDP-glucose 4-epimerase